MPGKHRGVIVWQFLILFFWILLKTSFWPVWHSPTPPCCSCGMVFSLEPCYEISSFPVHCIQLQRMGKHCSEQQTPPSPSNSNVLVALLPQHQTPWANAAPRVAPHRLEEKTTNSKVTAAFCLLSKCFKHKLNPVKYGFKRKLWKSQKSTTKKTIDNNRIFLANLLLNNDNFFQCCDYTRRYRNKITGDFICSNLCKAH